jgi:hypothetical protein
MRVEVGVEVSTTVGVALGATVGERDGVKDGAAGIGASQAANSVASIRKAQAKRTKRFDIECHSGYTFAGSKNLIFAGLFVCICAPSVFKC